MFKVRGGSAAVVGTTALTPSLGDSSQDFVQYPTPHMA